MTAQGYTKGKEMCSKKTDLITMRHGKNVETKHTSSVPCIHFILYSPFICDVYYQTYIK